MVIGCFNTATTIVDLLRTVVGMTKFIKLATTMFVLRGT